MAPILEAEMSFSAAACQATASARSNVLASSAALSSPFSRSASASAVTAT